jgi:hypothetical protein
MKLGRRRRTPFNGSLSTWLTLSESLKVPNLLYIQYGDIMIQDSSSGSCVVPALLLLTLSAV